MRRVILLVLTVLALAACGSSPNRNSGFRSSASTAPPNTASITTEPSATNKVAIPPGTCQSAPILANNAQTWMEPGSSYTNETGTYYIFDGHGNVTAVSWEAGVISFGTLISASYANSQSDECDFQYNGGNNNTGPIFGWDGSHLFAATRNSLVQVPNNPGIAISRQGACGSAPTALSGTSKWQGYGASYQSMLTFSGTTLNVVDGSQNTNSTYLLSGALDISGTPGSCVLWFNRGRTNEFNYLTWVPPSSPSGNSGNTGNTGGGPTATTGSLGADHGTNPTVDFKRIQ